MDAHFKQEFLESFHEYGEVRCRGCETTVEFADNVGVDDAIETWNDHIKAEHPENHPEVDA